MNATPDPARADRLGGAAWIAFGLAIFVGAWRMDRFESMGATLYTAPGLVPGVYGLLLIVLGTLLMLRRRAPAPDAATTPLLNRRIGLMLLLTLVYAALGLGRLPFAPLTAVFVALFCWSFAEHLPAKPRLGLSVATGLGTALVVVLVFERVFLVRLP